MCMSVREGEIDGIRGKEGLAVSQLDLLIPLPWGKGVQVCVCGLCLSHRGLSILAHLYSALWPS